MICNKCGMQNNGESRFCIGCGNALQTTIEPVNFVNNNLENNMRVMSNDQIGIENSTSNTIPASNNMVVNNTFVEPSNSLNNTPTKKIY